MQYGLHYGLQHLVDEYTNFFSDLPSQHQADVLVEFYEEPDNVNEMLAGLESPSAKDTLAVATRAQLVRLLNEALRKDLRPGVSEDAKADAFRALGEQVANWAYNHAERVLDEHIELHFDDLVGSEEDRRISALEA